MAEVSTYRNYIGGEWRESSGGLFEVKSPADGSLVYRAQRSTVGDMRDAIAAARGAFETTEWRDDPNARTQALFKFSAAVHDRHEDLAHLLTRESGKPYPVSRMEALRLSETTSYFAGLTRWIFGRSQVPQPNSISLIMREPIGVVGIIVPWNAPLALLARALAPALAAGNAVVVKPASYTAGSTVELAKILEGIPEFPRGIVNIVTGPGDPVGAELARHHDVDMISFTGDTSTGREIMRLAAENLKKVSLELGGKSPTIVFADANFDRAIRGALNAASFYNAGQICIAGTRVLVEASIHDAFVDRIKDMVPKMKVGPGWEKGVEVGPVISESQLEKVSGYIEQGKREAVLVAGGHRLTDGALAKGYFIAPTVFDQMRPDARIAQEEIFGPVMGITTFQDLDEAIRLANNTVYGLVAAVWTRDINKAMKIATRVRAGSVWVNTFGKMFQSTEMGGFKQSGLGRQYGLEGLFEYTELKHVNIQIEK
ncbi:MAG: aldehyde dehydrogenase family protein [Bacillati bacterium ANGP1]|uniref:Aldehyde dehydrogenase family protein n=1 Tax=Candidatus Segetimicrobium genomatis TaxID=2569760 RepID=A0A537M7I1_9BACT|nr:MAG: aldehyde dehydrogenase family protein [Terrabacteria group bacterium ANGP1]